MLDTINTLFQIEINRPQFTDDEGNIKISFPFFSNYQKVFGDKNFYFTLYDKFERVVWSSEMTVNHFSYWPGITWTRAEIIDGFNNLIWNWKWDPIKDGCICHQIFHLWSLQNRGAFGIVIGTHDGCTGEWVGSVYDGILKALLIECSDNQYEKLKEKYNGKSWVKLEQNLITTDGKKVKFYEGGKGYTNSIFIDHIINTGIYDVVETEKESESIISLLSRNPNCRWLHIDVEGLDDLLILSLKGRVDLLPDLIIYEHENLSQEREEKLVSFLTENGFSIYKSKSRNSIALK